MSCAFRSNWAVHALLEVIECQNKTDVLKFRLACSERFEGGYSSVLRSLLGGKTDPISRSSFVAGFILTNVLQ